MQAKRDVFQAVKGGTDALRAAGKKYLPKYEKESDPKYTIRLNNFSTIDGIVSAGVDSLCGAVFYGDIDVSDVNPQIQPLLENIDNQGNSFNVFSRRAFEESFDGFSVILVDQPSVNKSQVQSLEDKNRLGIRPYWRIYTAANVWNWRYRVNPISQARELSLLVLREITDEYLDRFESVSVTRYRVYSFDQNNKVSMDLWKENPGKEGDEKFTQEGSTVTFPFFSAIPAAIIGCLDDEPKLLIESRLEILAYQKESSFNKVEYMQGSPILILIGNSDPLKPIVVGSDAKLDIPIGGDAKYLQLDSKGHESLKQTIAGIKNTVKGRLNLLVEAAMKQAGQKTATEAVIEDRDKQSRLIVWAEQFKDALELVLQFTAEAMGIPSDKAGEIELNSRWNSDDDPAKQGLLLTSLGQKRDVLDIPLNQLRLEAGYTQEQIDEFDKENALLPEVPPVDVVPNDAIPAN